MLAGHFDPIVAIATASGRGAVGIVRVSGRGLMPFVEALLGRPLAPRHATLLPFPDAAGAPIDQGLALYFPAPHSYTGEDVLELQAHGGPVVLQLLVARCLEVAGEADRTLPHEGPRRELPPHESRSYESTPHESRPRKAPPPLPALRLARPGEFTQRAYLNDKLDLAQAEAVGDLIEASTEAAARSAGRSLSGAFSDEINTLRDGLIQLRLLVEATLDFPEEEIDFLEQANARGRLEAIAAQVDTVVLRARQGVLLREGITVVLAGQPNVGKSSLLNALAGAELAIVTPIAGTTRDKVTATIQIEGVPLHVVDTAGLREIGAAAHRGGNDAGDQAGNDSGHAAGDEVERIGIERSWDEIERADAVLFLRDLTRLGEPAYDAGDARIAQRLPASLLASKRLLQVFNKADAGIAPPSSAHGLALSALTGDGIEALRERLLELAGWQPQAEGVFIARGRHLQALAATRAHLTIALAHTAAGDTALDLLAEELRLANDALGAITGAFGADELLGEIFSRFCIGK